MKHITGAEALELVEAATPGPWEHSGASVRVRGALSVGALAVAAYGHPEENAALIAAAPDLARTVIALEAERDALRALVVAYGQAHDARTAHSKRAGNGAEMWFAERDELNNAVSDALAALREAAK